VPAAELLQDEVHRPRREPAVWRASPSVT
jgi:hypothetical protein